MNGRNHLNPFLFLLLSSTSLTALLAFCKKKKTKKRNCLERKSKRCETKKIIKIIKTLPLHSSFSTRSSGPITLSLQRSSVGAASSSKSSGDTAEVSSTWTRRSNCSGSFAAK